VTNVPRPTKNQRREEARESARTAREKNLKKQQLLKWLVPTVASIAILAIAAGVVWAVIAFQPPPKKEAGPVNMLSDGIVFEADGNGGLQPVPTAAIAKDAEPVPTEAREGLLNIVTFVDFACPHCKSFEDAYGPTIKSLVANGQATLEVRSVAFINQASVRGANAAACVANYEPEKYLEVFDAIFAKQGQGSSTSFFGDIVKSVGVDNDEVNECVRGDSFTPWVEAASARSGVRGTPTVIVNGTTLDLANEDFNDFLANELAKLGTAQ
jgi:protein-disulfide isomerase